MRPKDDFMRKNVSIAAFKHSTILLTEKTRLSNHKAPEDTYAFTLRRTLRFK